MITLSVIFWTLVIFTSIAWYGFLIFYIGYKGARELKILTRTLGKRENPEDRHEQET